MKKIGLIIMVLSLVIQVFPMKNSFAQSADSRLESFSSQTMDKIKNADFESLFNDFYLPKGYTEDDTQKDKEAIIAGLRELIQNKTGVLEEFSSVGAVAEKLIMINISTGSPQTTGNLPSTDLFYKVMFKEFGYGYITIGCYKEGDKLFIKNIIVGLPVSNPYSMGIAQDFGRFMMNMAVEQQKRGL